jgi:hypothetical protein
MDEIRSFPVSCTGGLYTSLDVLTQATQLPGTAIRLINYEPSIRGGYQRIQGFTNDYGTIPGTGTTLGLVVFEDLNDGIFGCRAPTTGNNYFHYWDTGTSAWITPSTVGTPTMTGVIKVRFSKLNWGLAKLAMVDGVNPLALWDGTTYTQVTAGSVLSQPSLCESFANHLFLSGDSTEPNSLVFSAPEDPTDFTPANGAGVINVGFKINAIKSFRDTLYIFGTNNIKKVVGSSIANFALQDVTKNLGCVAPDSVVEFNGDLLFLGPDGIRPISGTDRIGDVEINTISKPVQSVFENLPITEDTTKASILVLNKKSQFRMFFPDAESLGVIGALRRTGQGGVGFEFSRLIGINMVCGDSSYLGDEEYIIHGNNAGLVFRQESGNTFNGVAIESIYQTPYFHMDDPINRKVIHEVYSYLRADGAINVTMGLTFDYEDEYTLSPTDYTFNTEGAASFYGVATYDETSIFDGNPSPLRRTTVEGSGRSVSITYVTTDSQPSHSIEALVLSYAIADKR